MNLLVDAIYILSHLPLIIMIIGIILSTINLKHFTKKEYPLYTLLILSLLNDIAGRILGEIYKNNLITIPIYGIFLLLCMFFFFYYSGMKYKVVNYLILGILLIFNIYELFTINFSEFKEFQSYSNSIHSVYFLILTIFQLIYNLDNPKFNSKLNYFLMAFFALNALISLPLNLLVNYKFTSIYIMWFANVVLFTIFYSYISMYLWNLGKTQKR